MHPHRAFVLLPAVLLACGDSSSDSSFGDSASQASAASQDTGAPDTTAPPVPTTSNGESATAADADATVASADDTDSDTAATTISGDPTTDTAVSASATTTTGVTTDASSSSDTTTTSDDTTTTADDTTTSDTNNCPQGTEGCPCGPNDNCNRGLVCAAGECVVDPGPQCGDGVVEGNEACDLGGMNSNTGACKLDCTEQTCGDGFVGPGEACDDGNFNNGDGCEANCTKTPMVSMDNCGVESDGYWIEIDYDDAFSPTNPDWAYGGWTESQWAPQGSDWPYINAIGGVQMNDDQGAIGTVAGLYGTNKYIRVFIGLAGMSGYDYVTACVEGRSYSVGSSVTFRVENALNDCGGQAQMSNDWLSLHPTNVDVGDNCFIPGDDFQAIEIRPVSGSGSLSFKRMRVTFHGAF